MFTTGIVVWADTSVFDLIDKREEFRLSDCLGLVSSRDLNEVFEPSIDLEWTASWWTSWSISSWIMFFMFNVPFELARLESFNWLCVEGRLKTLDVFASSSSLAVKSESSESELSDRLVALLFNEEEPGFVDEMAKWDSLTVEYRNEIWSKKKKNYFYYC